MSANLATIPQEIFDLIVLEVDYSSLLALRLLCRELHEKSMEAMREKFEHVTAPFERRCLDQLLKLAPYSGFQRFTGLLDIDLTNNKTVLESSSGPGWERDELGYFVNPEKIYEVQTLQSIASKLPSLRHIYLQFYTSQFDQMGGLNHLPVADKLSPALAVCAAMDANIKVVKLGTTHLDSHVATLSRLPFFWKWDVSRPLLDTACGYLQTLEVTLARDMKDLDWIEMFFLKCSALENLRVRGRFGLLSVRLPHRFVSDIAAAPGIVPPVQALVVTGMGVEQESLKNFIGRFKGTLRRIDLYSIHMHGEEGWPPFLQWLQENIPNLESFVFQDLTTNFPAQAKRTLCFDSICDDPTLNFVTLKKAPWRSYTKLSSGTLALDIPDISTCLEMSRFCANLEKGLYKVDKPSENRQVYTVGFKGSNSGLREALSLITRVAEVQYIDGRVVRCGGRSVF
ncbi:hypothetical protein V492_00660 [Pseudogymnoascus sp. VKM F-4246]|nr:hypothetical protein V492_00660 [Pseudogymnoascus sp. VKM F-4246]